MKAIILIAVLIMLTGCSSNDDDGGTGGSTAGSSDSGSDDSGGTATEGQSNNDLAAHDSDVYDPNNDVSNACSSQLWDAIAGTYQGTIEVTGATGGSTCAWDIDIGLKRTYEPNTNRGVCNLETNFNSSFATAAIAEDSACELMNLTGVVRTEFNEPELSNPTWPKTLIVDLDSDFEQTAELAPLDFPRRRSPNIISTVELNVNDSGGMFYRPILYTDVSFAYWDWNVQRVERDVAP